MKNILFLFSILFTTCIIAQTKDTVYLKYLEQFEKANQEIFPRYKSGSVSLKNRVIEARQAMENYLEQYERKFKIQNNIPESEEVYFDYVVDIVKESKINNPKYFNPIIDTDNGQKVELIFGRSNDKSSSFQKVNEEMIFGLEWVINETNKSLTQQGLRPIKQLYISTTTNGEHSTYSNHYSGTAIDISEINGIRIEYTRLSLNLKSILKKEGIDLKTYDLSSPVLIINESPYQTDELFLFDYVAELQMKMLVYPKTRENFGPFMFTKYLKESDSLLTSNHEKMTSIKRGMPHEHHIHFNVR